MWKKITKNNVISNYSVSDIDGVVRNDVSGHIMKHTKNKYGYYTVYLTFDGLSKTCSVHQLVAQAYIPNPENKRTVNHKTGDKSKNSADDLEWATDLENIQHAWRTGLATARCGEKIGNSVNTEEQIRDVCELILEGVQSNERIFEITGVKPNIITFIRQKKLWVHISSQYDLPDISPRNKYREIYPIIDDYLSKGFSAQQIIDKYPLNIKRKHYIALIRRRQNRRSTTIL